MTTLFLKIVLFWCRIWFALCVVYLLLSFTPQGALLPDFVDECLENDVQNYLEIYLDGDLMM